MKAKLCVLPGDGIGPEVTAEAVKVLDAVARRAGHTFEYEEHLLGGCSIDRHGTALTAHGKLHVKNAVHALSDDPIDDTCPCEVCARHSRGYVRHLFQVGEPTASRLLSIHNVAWTLDLMARIRAAIGDGTFAALRAEVMAVWA